MRLPQKILVYKHLFPSIVRRSIFHLAMFEATKKSDSLRHSKPNETTIIPPAELPIRPIQHLHRD